MSRMICTLSMVLIAGFALHARDATAGLFPRALIRGALPTTQPNAPAVPFTAVDLPLRLKGATGELARRLKPFDVPPERFQYTLRLIEDADDFKIYRLTFPSPFRSPFPENNVVPAEFYVPKQAAAKVPAAVVLDIMQGSAIVPRGLARGLASQGVAALYIPMAYYNSRRPKADAHLRWMEQDPAHVIEPLKQTVMDIRRGKAILASRAEIDPNRIGITGVSLGGIMTALAAGVDGDFYPVAPILSGGDLAALTFHAPETRHEREKLVADGIDQQKLEKIVAPVEPLDFAARIDPRRCLMINAARDEVIPKTCTQALWIAAGKPRLLWLPSGHYSAAWYLPTIKQTAIDFLKGNPVEGLEY
jgi:dienelactone hydrolase